AVFLRGTDAVVAAVDAQQAIQAEPWPDRLSVSVRMAVLTGEADAADRDYRSPAVNRCAKLRRRAVGNQILVSETTYSIVAYIRPGLTKQLSSGQIVLVEDLLISLCLLPVLVANVASLRRLSGRRWVALAAIAIGPQAVATVLFTKAIGYSFANPAAPNFD